MKKYILLWGIICCVCDLVAAQQKYALVIGNGAYTSITQLRNPVNDANAIAVALQSLGWNVDKVQNGSLNQMINAVTRFKNRLQGSPNSYGFFFYAGHGVQSNGENYLIPVDATIPSESYLRQMTLSVQTTLDELNEAGNALNIIVLDACRDNPFGWKRSGSRGLTVVNHKPADSIIVYATATGSTAADGTGQNGLFTTHLLNNMKNQELEVKDVFTRTGRDVALASNNQQRPEIAISFYDSAYLGNRRGGVQPAPAPAPKPAAVQPTPAPAPKPATVQPTPSPAPAVKPDSGGKTYKIGDTGPGGGIVFYVKGNSGLEVSPLLGSYTWEEAKNVARNYKGGGLSGWYLPSKDELNLVYQNLQKAGIVNLGTDWYWSSSEFNLYTAWRQRFSDGNQAINYGGSKGNTCVVRAVRAFNY